MPYARGAWQYNVGEVNNATASVDWAMIQRAQAGGKMDDAQYKDFSSLVKNGFQSGICFALSTRWAADFIYFRRRLDAMVRPPYGLVSQRALDKALQMQSEHMTRVRKRVAQEKWESSVTEMERKVIRKYALLDQKEIYSSRPLKSPDQRRTAAVDVIFAMTDSCPLRLGLTFTGSGHDLGLVRQGSHRYIFDPNYGLFRYDAIVPFARDLEALLTEDYDGQGLVPEEFSLHELFARA